jgi:hypothetical protein
MPSWVCFLQLIVCLLKLLFYIVEVTAASVDTAQHRNGADVLTAGTSLVRDKVTAVVVCATLITDSFLYRRRPVTASNRTVVIGVRQHGSRVVVGLKYVRYFVALMHYVCGVWGGVDQVPVSMTGGSPVGFDVIYFPCRVGVEVTTPRHMVNSVWKQVRLFCEFCTWPDWLVPCDLVRNRGMVVTRWHVLTGILSIHSRTVDITISMTVWCVGRRCGIVWSGRMVGAAIMSDARIGFSGVVRWPGRVVSVVMGGNVMVCRRDTIVGSDGGGVVCPWLVKVLSVWWTFEIFGIFLKGCPGYGRDAEVFYHGV